MLDVTTDPVCGMTLGSADAVASALTDGRRFHFCCPRCHAAFLDTPHRYVGWANQQPRPLGTQDGRSTRAEATNGTATSPDVQPCDFPVVTA